MDEGLSPDLARQTIYLRLSDEQKAGVLDTFFVKVKEELDITPAKVQVLEYLQENAVFVEAGSRRLIEAERPRHPPAGQGHGQCPLYMQGDETCIQVLKEPGLKASSHKWM